MDNIKKPIRRKKIIILTIVLLVLVAGLLYLLLSSQNQNVKKGEITNFTPPINPVMKKIGESQIPQAKERTVAEPNKIEAWINLLLAEQLTGDTATTTLEKVEQMLNSAPQPYLDLGHIYEAKGDMTKAEENYKKAVYLDYKEIPLDDKYFSASAAAATMTAAESAEYTAMRDEFLVRLPKQISHMVTPYTALSNLYLKLNKPNEAIKVLELGITMNPKYPDFYYWLSAAYKKVGNQAKADEAWSNFKKLVPDFPGARP